MPAYWINLAGLPDSPIGIGVTGKNEADAARILEEAEIDWHTRKPVSFKPIGDLKELGMPAVRRAIKASIDHDGVWFPVYDTKQIMRCCAELTFDFRYSAENQIIRHQLLANGIRPEEIVFCSVDPGQENDEVAISICHYPRTFLTVLAKWDSSTRKFGEIVEIRNDEEPEEWDANVVFVGQICSGRLKSQFEKLMDEQLVIGSKKEPKQ